MATAREAASALVVLSTPRDNDSSTSTTVSKRRQSIHRERRRLTHNLLYALLLASLVLPVYRSLSCCECRFWSAPWGDGFWETEVLLNWKNMGQQYPDWEEKQYLANYRISKETFWFLCERLSFCTGWHKVRHPPSWLQCMQ